MKGIIKSTTGLVFACIAGFFIFALQGLGEIAASLGIISFLLITIKSLLISPDVKERSNAIYSPSRSRRVKNKRLRVA